MTPLRRAAFQLILLFLLFSAGSNCCYKVDRQNDKKLNSKR